MRKYIMNSAIIGAVFGGFQTLQATRKGPRDWRLILMWIGWAITVAIAIGTVAENSKTHELER